jgi:DNA-binding transcriptional ArsR family regulator
VNHWLSDIFFLALILYFQYCENMKNERRNKTSCCGPRNLLASKAHVEAFKALAHAGRLQVFFHLVQAGKPVQANEIQSALGIPGPTLSHHLNELEQAGLIERRREERFIYSSVRREMVLELVRLLTACC